METVKENDPRFGIYIKDGVPLNASDKAALESAGHKETDLKALKKTDPDIDKKLMQYMCGHYFDIRTFGAVMTTFGQGFGSTAARCAARFSSASPKVLIPSCRRK